MQKFFSAERSTSKCLWRDSPPRSPRLCPWPALGRATAMSSTSSLDVRTSQSAVSLFSLGSNRMKGRVICSAPCWLWTKYIVFQCSLVFHYVFEALPADQMLACIFLSLFWLSELKICTPSSLQLSSSASRFQVTCWRWPSLTHLQPSHPYRSSAPLLWKPPPSAWLLSMLTLLNQLQPTPSEFGWAVHRNILKRRQRPCSRIFCIYTQ